VEAVLTKADGQRQTADREAAGPRSERRRTAYPPRLLLGAFALALFLLAWVPRLAAINVYLTTDEGNWMGRAALFARGSLDGDPLLTRQSGHPGVSTMYTALAGLGLDNALFLADYVRPDGLEKAPGYLELIRQARRPFTVLSALAVVGIALLTWRLFGAGPALIVGVLLALEPFLLAHAGVVHLDGMLSSYMTLALLSALIYWVRGAGRGYLVLCGLLTGLAFLTKTPSAILALFIPALALISAGRRGELRSAAGWRRLAIDGLIWGGLAGSLALLAWPSLRADFVGTLQYMVQYTEDVGGGDHENFFRGQPTSEPGPLYYVVAFGLRSGPAMLVGVVLLGLLLLPIGPRRAPREWRGPLLGLLAYIAAFTIMMMIPPKKFDRYILPTFPAWEILAAVGFWLALTRLLPRWSGRVLPVLLLALAVGQAALIVPVYPYFMSYYNPLFGGGRAAAKNIVVGWGEGLDQVTSYLNAKPDADRLTLAGFYPRVLMAQFKGSVLPDKQYDPAEADYIVLYINAVQRDLANTLRTAIRGRKPEQIVTINGIEYARLFRVPPPPGKSAAGTEFGPLRLDRTFLRSEERRYLKSDDIHAGDTLQLTLRWTLLEPVERDYYATFTLLDRQGRPLVEQTGQIGGPDESTTSVRVGDFVTETHRLVLPLEAVGDYNLAVAVRPSPEAPPLAVSVWPDKLGAEARREPNRVVVDSVQARPPEPAP
jgi:dolichyl-phosphate-mannose-protein mannosyltransferase